ncbi:MAG: glycosyltransferase family 2 protein [Cyclobacteriaceae bacterium]|nr:glycosyltransferase family 2 protein [Cyclobacteriaceae bacterium]
MKVSGFSFIRNAIRYDYPLEEAIRSILPLCDDFYVAVGRSEDDTLELVRSIDPGIIIIETEWDDSLKEGGRVLAMETEKAFSAIPGSSDWCIYIQADEVIHEKYQAPIREGMERWKDNPEVDGLLFNYLHFFGSYDYIATAPNWYRKEIRIIRNDKSIYSYRDAQGFRKGNNKKLCVKPVDAYVYHYGWVKHPEVQIRKHRDFHKLYHPGEWKDSRMNKANEFDYSIIDAVGKFEDTHPRVMLPRIKAKNWEFDRDISYNKMNFKNRLRSFLEKKFGIIPGEYKNYKLI